MAVHFSTGGDIGFEILPRDSKPSSSYSLFVPVESIVGILKVKNGAVLLCVTERIIVARDPLSRSPIYMIQRAMGIPISSDISIKTGHTVYYTNEELIGMSLNLLSNGSFFFAPYYDLASSLQQQAPTSDTANIVEKKLKWNKHSCQAWAWNYELMREFLLLPELTAFFTPIICGRVEEGEFHHRGDQYKLLVIARRSTVHQGTRYNKRGVDELGNAANFCEIEQIIVSEDIVHRSVVNCSIYLYCST